MVNLTNNPLAHSAPHACFVIYKTHRLMPEEEWTRLLRECGLGTNYDAVVLSGDAKAV